MQRDSERSPQYLDAAVEATMNGIDSFLLRERPKARRAAVLEFGRAVEYLMRYALCREEDPDHEEPYDNEELRKRLKSRYQIEVGKKPLKELRNARNASEHRADVLTADELFGLVRRCVLPLLETFFEETLGFRLEALFSGRHLSILRREELSPDQETQILMSAAGWYASRDPELTVNLAQTALERVVRLRGRAVGYDDTGMDIREYVENWQDYLDSLPPDVEPDGAYALVFYTESDPRPIDDLFKSYQQIPQEDLAEYLFDVHRAIKECLKGYDLAQTPQESMWEEAIERKQPDIVRDVVQLSPSAGQMLARTNGDISWTVRRGSLSVYLFSLRSLSDILLLPATEDGSIVSRGETEAAGDEGRQGRVLDATEEEAITTAIRIHVPDFPERFPMYVSIPRKYEFILEE